MDEVAQQYDRWCVERATLLAQADAFEATSATARRLTELESAMAQYELAEAEAAKWKPGPFCPVSCLRLFRARAALPRSHDSGDDMLALRVARDYVRGMPFVAGRMPTELDILDIDIEARREQPR